MRDIHAVPCISGRAVARFDFVPVTRGTQLLVRLVTILEPITPILPGLPELKEGDVIPVTDHLTGLPDPRQDIILERHRSPLSQILNLPDVPVD